VTKRQAIGKMYMAQIVLGLLLAYVAVGAGVGVALIARGIEQMDPAAHAAPWTFRLLILPGVVALWPILVRRWRQGSRTRTLT